MAIHEEEGFVENCWFIYGIRIGIFCIGWVKHHSSGSTGGVSFDLDKVIDHPRFLGWVHTHPGEGFVQPSSTDHKTMRGWVRTQGRPLLCVIVSGSEGATYEYARKYSHGPIVYWNRSARLFSQRLFISYAVSWLSHPAK